MAYEWKGLFVLLLLLALAGCTAQSIQVPVVTPEVEEPEPEPVAEVSPEPVVVVRAPPAETTAQPKTVVPPHVAILVSLNIPAYNDVATRLQQSLEGRATRHVLDEHTAQVLELSTPGPIVAIGLEAALLARTLQGVERPVIFCQVFNHVEHELLAEHADGVELLPSFRKTFATWRALAPELRDVAVFTGSGFVAAMTRAKAAASAYGITLRHHVVGSDKELLYEYKQASDQIDGLWLLPDNRILSRNTIQELMSYSLRNGKQVAVFNEQLLPLGGLFSVTGNPEEVAAKVLHRLEALTAPVRRSGPVLFSLEDAVVSINPVIAQRFNLVIPQSLSHHVVE